MCVCGEIELNGSLPLYDSVKNFFKRIPQPPLVPETMFLVSKKLWYSVACVHLASKENIITGCGVCLEL